MESPTFESKRGSPKVFHGIAAPVSATFKSETLTVKYELSTAMKLIQRLHTDAFWHPPMDCRQSTTRGNPERNL